MVKYKIKYKDDPNDSPGTWKESKLIFKARGSKYKLEKILKVIEKALGEIDE